MNPNPDSVKKVYSIKESVSRFGFSESYLRMKYRFTCDVTLAMSDNEINDLRKTSIATTLLSTNRILVVNNQNVQNRTNTT